MSGTLNRTRTSTSSGVPVFQKIFETAQGGFTLDETVLVAGTVIPAGTVIGFDETTRKAKPFKGGVLQANATNVATTYRILKGSNVAVGMSLFLAGGTARAITAIDTSNASYDELTVGTTIGVAATAGDTIYVVDDGFAKAKGLLLDDATVPASGTTETIAVMIRGTVYHNRIAPVSAVVQALMKNIIFSDSY
jgi:hypothetical protein